MEQQEQTSPQITKETHCPVCLGAQIQPFFTLEQLPVLSNVLWERREDALKAPRADIRLAFCADCGHVFNQAFDPRMIDYHAPYENSLHYSPRFQRYANLLARHLIEKYDLRGKSIIEIGSGKGDFLRLLCEMGGNTGMGFDPSYKPAPEDQHPRVSLVQNEYSQRFTGIQADLIISRHVLEHIFQPAALLQELRRTIGEQNQTPVYFEVPNLNYILRDTAVWDIIYEHYSYFSPQSLVYLFTNHGFALLDLAEAFEGQFLSIEAVSRRISDSKPFADFAPAVAALSNQVHDFARRSQEKIARWETQIQSLQQHGKRAVVWGAGSKGISLLNMLHVQEAIPYIIDINPRKRNMYVTGSGQQIVPPEFLQTYRPDTVIIMNPIYQQEIQTTVENLGLQVEYLLAV